MKLRIFQALRSGLLLPCLWLPFGVQAQGYCFEQAGIRYGVSPMLLRVIAQKESGMNPRATNANRNGTRDIGLMQINSRWPMLARHGVAESDLFEPCTNTHVAAWILASNFRQFGLRWEAIGAYNARSHNLRAIYAGDVILRLRRAAGLT